MAAITSRNINNFQEFLIGWYDQNGRYFPWRKKRLTQYQIVIAETLLERTKAETVAKFYRHFIKDYPNWKALSEANVEVI